MDLLFSKYASPFEFMRPYIDNGRFGEFVNEILKAENTRRKEQAEKEADKSLWEFWLHNVTDMTFQEFKDSLRNKNKNKCEAPPEDEDVKQIVTESVDILKGFRPCQDDMET